MKTNTSSTPKFTIANVKVGDYLIRRNDHLGRPDETLRVVAVYTKGRRSFDVNRVRPDGSEYRAYGYSLTGGQLSADNTNTVVRDGIEVGRFCVKYW